MNIVECFIIKRTQLPCKHCREDRPVPFGGQTVQYTILPRNANMRMEDMWTGRVDYISIAACPKCGRRLNRMVQ